MFFKLSLNVVYQALFRKKRLVKMIGHHARLRDMTDQSYQFNPVLLLITRVIHRSYILVIFCGGWKHNRPFYSCWLSDLVSEWQ